MSHFALLGFVATFIQRSAITSFDHRTLWFNSHVGFPESVVLAFLFQLSLAALTVVFLHILELLQSALRQLSIMPSSATFVRLCQERNLQIPQSPAAVEARLAQSHHDSHVDSSKFNGAAAKREAVATLIWALATIQERNNKLVYSRWNHLSPSSLLAIRKLYDVPQERGRPASLAKVARHFWDNRPVGGPVPVPAAVQRQS